MDKKNVLIAGVGRREGLGFVTAEEFGKLGYRVIISAKKAEQVEPLVKDILVNAVCPGVMATYQVGGFGGRDPRISAQKGVVWAATLPDDGPTGGFFRDGEVLPW